MGYLVIVIIILAVLAVFIFLHRLSLKEKEKRQLEQKAKRLEQEAREDKSKQQTLERELEWMRQGAKARQAKSKARIKSYNEMADSSERERLTRDTIERRLQDIDLADVYVHLEWDFRAEGLHVYVFPWGSGGTLRDHRSRPPPASNAARPGRTHPRESIASPTSARGRSARAPACAQPLSARASTSDRAREDDCAKPKPRRPPVRVPKPI